jgi:hypothetical protein
MKSQSFFTHPQSSLVLEVFYHVHQVVCLLHKKIHDAFLSEFAIRPCIVWPIFVNHHQGIQIIKTQLVML